MELKQIEAFVRVAELGSFTRAATALQVTQPALSRLIRSLEVSLRVNLLTRNGRGAVPTEAGKLLLAHGEGILHQVAQAREDLNRSGGAVMGHVAVGLPTSLARRLTVPLTRAFRHQHPEASLSIGEGLSTTLQDGIVMGRLDMALLYNPAPNPDLEWQTLCQEELVLVQGATDGKAGPGVTRQALAALPLIIPSRPNAFRVQVEGELATLGLQPQVALEIDGVSAILDLVADGLGCAVLGRHAVALAAQPRAYTQRPFDPPMRATVVLAASARRPATRTHQAMRHLLSQLTLNAPET